MNSLITYFCIIFFTWEIVYCELSDSNELGFLENIEETNYVDPFSFDYDRANKRMVEKPRLSRSEGICFNDNQCQKKLKICEKSLANVEFDKLYTIRLINLLLATARFQDNGDLLTGSITITGNNEQIEKLRQFEHGKITIQEVDAILSAMLTPTINFIDDGITLINHLFTTIHTHRVLSISVLLSIAILLAIKYVNWSTGRVINVLLSLILLVSYFNIWSQLLKNAELQAMVESLKYNGRYPIQCEPEKMNFWDRVITAFDKDDVCFKYYKSIKFDSFGEVTPIDALVETIDRLMVKPIGRFGSLIDTFINNSTQHLGFVTGWMVTIIMYLGVIVIIALVLISVTAGRVRFWFGPFCGLSIGGEQSNQTQRQRSLPGQREPIIYLSPVILERNSDGELKQIAHPIADDHSTIGGGDSRIQELQAKPENSTVTCSSCSCESSSNKSHVEESDTTKNDVRKKENGDGDG